MSEMVEILVRSGSAAKQRTDAVVLPLLAGRRLTRSGRRLAEGEAGPVIKRYLRKFDQSGDYGELGVLYEVPGMHSPRLMFAGIGEERELNLHKLRRLGGRLARKLDASGARDVSLYLPEAQVRGATTADKVRALAEGIWLGLYRFERHRSEKKENRRPLRSVTLMIPTRRELDVCASVIEATRADVLGTIFARDLGNEPGNVCTPTWLGEQAQALAHPKLKVTVMDRAAIEKAGFTGLLAVNRGSAEEPRFIVLEYQGGAKDQAPVALVGKGLTFDAGGICVKPPQHMDEMKFDMCGAAAVLGVFRGAIEQNLPVNLLGVIASTENLLGSRAYKPGDVIRTYKGLTVEVVNTDAEGRIILADALAYAAERKPAEIIDLATLTGACVIALGHQASGLMGNNELLLNRLHEAGERTHDRAWRLPMYEEYQEQIKSEIADIKNVGGRDAGTITAACFLSRFVGDAPWAHLDIAGTAWTTKDSELAPKGATGAGVRLLLEYLRTRAA